METSPELKGINHTFTAILHRIGDWSALAFTGMFLVKIGDFDTNQSRIAWIVLALAILISMLLFPAMSVYQRWRGETRARELYTVSIAWSLVFIILALFLWILGYDNSALRDLLIKWWLLGGFALTMVRLVIRNYLNKIRSQGGNLRNIIVVGNDKHTSDVIDRICKESWTGFNVVGYFGDCVLENVNVNKLGDFDGIAQYLENEKVDQVWIAMPLSDERMIEKLLMQFRFTTTNIRYLPDISGFMLINHSISEIAQMPVVNLTASPLQGGNYLIKEVEDKILSGMILLLISPIMIVIAFAVKISSPGPIFFRQERVSWNGKTFEMLKFRSMTMADEEIDNPEWGGAKSAKSARVTKLGAILRKTSLDELPQFLNVLKGDMSIVGPRPERPVFVEQFKHEIHGYMQKHLMKAGITGWAQINGWRGDTDLQKRIEFDLHYINNWSFWFDIKIVFLTLFKGFVNKNSG